MNLMIFTAVLSACEAANFNRSNLSPQGENSESGYGGSIFEEPVSQRGHKDNVKTLPIQSTASNLDGDHDSNDRENSGGLNFDAQHQQKESNSYDDFSTDKSGFTSEKSSKPPTRFDSKETFAYNYETENGIRAEENGIADDGVKARGSFSYVGDDGEMYRIAYTADENGYRPFGNHIPTSPPIPEAILRSIEQNAEDEAAGIFDDGKYHPEKLESGRHMKVGDEYNYDTHSSIQIQHSSDTNYSDNIPKTPEYLPKVRVFESQDSSDRGINNSHRINTAEDDARSLKYLTSNQDELIDHRKGQTGIEECNQANGFTASTQDDRAITGYPTMGLSETTPNDDEKVFFSNSGSQIIETPNEGNMYQGEHFTEADFRGINDTQIIKSPSDLSAPVIEAIEELLEFDVTKSNVSQEPLTNDENQESDLNKYVEGREEHFNVKEVAPQHVAFPELTSYSSEHDEDIYSSDSSNENSQQLDNRPIGDTIKEYHSNVENKPEPRVLNILEKDSEDVISSIQKADSNEEKTSLDENSKQKNQEIDQIEESPGFNGVAEVIDYIDSDIIDKAKTKTNENANESGNLHPKIYNGPSFEIRKTLNVTGEPKQYDLSEIDLEAKRKEYCKLRCKAHLEAIRKKQKDGNAAKTPDDSTKHSDIVMNDVSKDQKQSTNDKPQMYSNIQQNIATGLQILVDKSKNNDEVIKRNGDNDKQVNDVIENVTHENYPRTIKTKEENISSEDLYFSKNLSDFPPNSSKTIHKNLNVQPNVDVASGNNYNSQNSDDVESNEDDIQQNYNNPQRFDSYLSNNEPSTDFVAQNIQNTPDYYMELPKNISNVFKNYSQKVISNVPQNAVTDSQAIEPLNIARGSKSYPNKYQNIDNVPREIEISEQRNALGKSLNEQSAPMENLDQEDFSRSLFEEESSLHDALRSNDSVDDRLEEKTSQTRRPPYYEPDTGYHY